MRSNVVRLTKLRENTHPDHSCEGSTEHCRLSERQKNKSYQQNLKNKTTHAGSGSGSVIRVSDVWSAFQGLMAAFSTKTIGRISAKCTHGVQACGNHFLVESDK